MRSYHKADFCADCRSAACAMREIRFGKDHLWRAVAHRHIFATNIWPLWGRKHRAKITEAGKRSLHTDYRLPITDPAPRRIDSGVVCPRATPWADVLHPFRARRIAYVWEVRLLITL